MPSSPVAPAVENTLGLFVGENAVARGVDGQLAPCHVFSYREDFDYLWGIGEHEGESPAQDMDGECSVVLVYDGIPEAPGRSAGPSINVRDYITAYDWAVHFFLSSVAGNQVPNVRLFILDVTSSQLSTPFAARRLPGLLPLMPWLRVYRLFDDLTDLQRQFGRIGVGFMEMAAGLTGGDVPALGATDQGWTEAADEQVREAWVNNLTRPGGRHDVSNLVAPLILAGGLGRAEEVVGDDPQRAALAELLQTLRMIEDYRKSSAQVVSPLKTPLVQKNIFGQFDEIRFRLVDDQAALGYDTVLKLLLADGERSDKSVSKNLFSDKTFELQVTTDPGTLVESLFAKSGLSGDSGEKIHWSQPRVLDSVASESDGKGSQEFDVLLLDLRLFADSGSDGKRSEDDFLRRLVDFYKQSKARKLKDDSLKRAVRAAQNRMEKDSSASAEDAPKLMHLALLPLLLSYVDPSLPIVLFSSTRQQAVIEALSHRPSIITSFHKPVVSGYDEEISSHAQLKGLSDAIFSALWLHESRFIWRRIAKMEWTHMPVFETKREGWDSRTLDVYNVSSDASLPDRKWNGKRGTPRRNAGEQKPHIAGEEATVHTLRRALAEHYVHYILGSRYFDFTTIPWEMLNGGLVPKHIAESTRLTNSGFNLPEDLDPRNYAGGAIGSLRNKKAHGFGRPPRSQEKERYRLAAMMLFLLFLDFIEGAAAPQPRDDNLPKMKGYLRAQYDHVYKYSPSNKELSPYHFAGDSKVEWLEVTAFAASFAETKAIDPDTGETFLAERTIEAINRMVDDLTKKSTRSKLWIGLGNQKVSKGTISSWFDPAPDNVTGPLQGDKGLWFAFAEYNSPERFLLALGQRDDWPSNMKIRLHDDEK